MYEWCVGVDINRCRVFMCIDIWYSRYGLDILCHYVFNHAITSMMEYPSACNDSMVIPQCNRSPAMWLMLPGILQCRPMEGSTTLISWRLQWWMPWYPVLTGTCAFGRVANLEFRFIRSFWMKKKSTVLQVGWEELAAQCCGVAVTDWSLESQLGWLPGGIHRIRRQVYGAVLRSCKREGSLVYAWWTCFLDPGSSKLLYNSRHKTSSGFWWSFMICVESLDV